MTRPARFHLVTDPPKPRKPVYERVPLVLCGTSIDRRAAWWQRYEAAESERLRQASIAQSKQTTA